MKKRKVQVVSLTTAFVLFFGFLVQMFGLGLTAAYAASVTGIVSVADGGGFTLALRDDGTVLAWGANDRGQLGDNTNVAKSYPTPIPGLSGIVGIAAGNAHAVALKADGTVWTWGLNDKGQIGNGNNINQNYPAQVPKLNGVISVAAGSNHTVALKADGTVWTFGANASGQLGDETTAAKNLPVQVTGVGTAVQAIAAGGDFTMAIRRGDGSIWSWGENGNGQLGDGTTNDKNVPGLVSEMTNVTKIRAGISSAAAIKQDGTVWTWGENNYGQLADGVGAPNAGNVDRKLPFQVQALEGAADIVMGDAATLALKTDGTVYTAGNNYYGQLGDGSPQMSSVVQYTQYGVNYYYQYWRNTMMQIKDLSNVVAIYSGANHFHVLLKDGTLWGFGRGDTGQIGDEQAINRYKPVLTSRSFLTNLQPVAYSPSTITLNYGVNGTGDMYVSKYWLHRANTAIYQGTDLSYTDYGLTPGTTYSYKVEPYDSKGMELGSKTIYAKTRNKFATGSNFALALRDNGTVWAWGDNKYGQLGDGTTTSKTTPVQVPGLTDVVAIAAGYNHALALKADGTVWAWGDNTYGQLGDGTNSTSSTPVRVRFMTSASAVYAAANQSFVVNGDGMVRSFGNNANGQLGDGTTTSASLPTFVTGLKDVLEIAGGETFTVAVKTDGSLWSWGANDEGQLGDGTTDGHLAPALVPGLANVTTIAAGQAHALAVRADGTLWGFGRNNKGQVGDSTAVNKTVPTQIKGMIGMKAVGAGYNHSLAVKDDGTIWTWGDNWYGQLGDGTAEPKSAPVQVFTIENTATVFGSETTSYAVKANGTIWGFGLNTGGQIGDGTTTNRKEPTQSLAVMELYVNATPTATTNVLTFAGNGLVAKYVVKRDGKVIYTGQNITYTDTGLITKTNYSYTFEAYDKDGHLLGTATSVFPTI